MSIGLFQPCSRSWSRGEETGFSRATDAAAANSNFGRCRCRKEHEGVAVVSATRQRRTSLHRAETPPTVRCSHQHRYSVGRCVARDWDCNVTPPDAHDDRGEGSGRCSRRRHRRSRSGPDRAAARGDKLRRHPGPPEHGSADSIVRDGTPTTKHPRDPGCGTTGHRCTDGGRWLDNCRRCGCCY